MNQSIYPKHPDKSRAYYTTAPSLGGGEFLVAMNRVNGLGELINSPHQIVE
jgi:hypothetical protein